MLKRIFLKVFRKADNAILAGAVETERERRRIKGTQRNSATSFEAFYDNSDSNPLAKICDKYGSDKGAIDHLNKPYSWPAHNYTDFYHILFRSIRDTAQNVFECGLGTNNPHLKSSMGINGKPGASLRVWRDYFTNATIYGADIDSEILFEEDRIKTFYCDQTSQKSIVEFIEKAQIKNKSLEVIIDDGLHEYHAGVSLFEGMKDYLAKNGTYVIEDVKSGDKIKYIKYFEEFRNAYDFYVINLHRKNTRLGDNSLIVVMPKG